MRTELYRIIVENDVEDREKTFKEVISTIYWYLDNEVRHDSNYNDEHGQLMYILNDLKD